MSQLNVAVLEEMMRKLKAQKPPPLPDMLVMSRETWLDWARSGEITVAYRRRAIGWRRERFIVIDQWKVIPVHIYKDCPAGEAYALKSENGITRRWTR